MKQLAAKLHIYLAILLLFVTTSVFASSLQGTVVFVYDGDTLMLKDLNGHSHRIRLAGIDAPELDQPYGPEAAALLRKLVLNKPVLAELLEEDKYGREVAHVYYSSTQDVACTLLLEGAAWQHPFFDKQHSHYLIHAELQEEAMLFCRGLWAKEPIVPPWQWRRRHCV